MVYYIATVSFLLLLTVEALELDEITYLPSTYWPMLKYAPSSSSPSSSPLSSGRQLNVPFKRQGIIPGPRVGRSFASYSNDYEHYRLNDISNANKFNEYANVNNYHPELHEILSSSSGFKNRGKRSLRVNDISSSASSASSPSSSLTGPNVDMSNIDDSSSSNSMGFFARSTRQLIPAPRVGRSSSSSASSSLPLSNNLLLSPSSPNLFTGFSQAASIYNRGDDEGNNFETDQQVVNGQLGSLGAHGQIQLTAVPRGYLNQILTKDLFKRMALTPRIGRSSEGSPSSGGWFDDDDYYNRVIKSSFTPRVGRSVNVNGEKSSPTKNSKP